MKRISRRRALVGVGTVVAAGSGLVPRHARAAGELTVWWTQGFYKAENDAVIAWMAEWEKRNNTKVNLTIMNGPDVITKLIAGMQVGDEAPWNYLMAAAIVYAIPPLIIYYGFRRRMSGGLTMGGVKG